MRFSALAGRRAMEASTSPLSARRTLPVRMTMRQESPMLRIRRQCAGQAHKATRPAMPHAAVRFAPPAPNSPGVPWQAARASSRKDEELRIASERLNPRVHDARGGVVPMVDEDVPVARIRDGRDDEWNPRKTCLASVEHGIDDRAGYALVGAPVLLERITRRFFDGQVVWERYRAKTRQDMAR